MNDKSREHVGVAKPKSAFDPNAAQPNLLLLLGHPLSVVRLQFLPVFILQEYPNISSDARHGKRYGILAPAMGSGPNRHL